MVHHRTVVCIVLVTLYSSVASSFSITHSSVAHSKRAVSRNTRRSAENRDGGNAAPEECSILDAELGAGLKKLGDLEPLERRLIRLDGFDPYILVGVLTASASYQTLSDLEIASGPGAAPDAKECLLFLGCFGSIICGLYSTIVFSLTVLYGKTALGMDREAAYCYFLEQTAGQRERGYQAFTLSLASFGANILILAVDTLPDKFAPLASVVAFGIFIFGVKEWMEITDAANPIFTNILPQSADKGGKEEI